MKADAHGAASHNAAMNPWESIVGAAVGGLLGLALIKFGNPVILDRKIAAPQDLIELILLPWPVAWGYALVGLVTLLSLKWWRWQIHAPIWIIPLPLAWGAWQALSSLATEDASLSRITLTHFASCVVWFYLGLFALSRVSPLTLLWLGLLGGFTFVLAVGWRQHFGGFEETRRYFYQLPNWREYPPEFLRKISSDRIYSTLFYPNTLAGAILLLLPPMLALIWEVSRHWASVGRITALGTPAIAALACLYWSGSKAGWLILLAMALMAFLHLPIRSRIKWAVLSLALVAGLGGFFLRYSGYFQRGATSVSARVEYWRAALTLTKEHPLLGSGPGTFQIGYKRLKKPDAEMARLTHNDYLEQAADSGFPAAVLYVTLVCGSLLVSYRWSVRVDAPLRFGLWLGTAGLALQAFVEFPLYVPALSWPMFLFLGWLWSARAQPSKV